MYTHTHTHIQLVYVQTHHTHTHTHGAVAHLCDVYRDSQPHTHTHSWLLVTAVTTAGTTVGGWVGADMECTREHGALTRMRLTYITCKGEEAYVWGDRGAW